MPSFKTSGYKDIVKFKAYRKRQKQKDSAKLKHYIESKKQPCLFCGTTENIEFHHVNPTKKEYTVTSLARFSFKKIDEETAKCWCLCQECHKKFHQGLCSALVCCYESYI
jgi:5-methylcytosine-specific restriction endonuclease McrA